MSVKCIYLTRNQKKFLIELLKEAYNSADIPKQGKISAICLKVIVSMTPMERSVFRDWAISFFGLDFDFLPQYLRHAKTLKTFKRK